MKKMMMKYLMLNCKQATFLMAKKEEGLLSFLERMKLYMHTSMCSYCKKFDIQSNEIVNESKHIHTEDPLPSITREKIEILIKNHLN